MTVRATNIIPPVLSATEVVALFFPGMTAQTSLGNLFRGLVLERNYLGYVSAAVDVRFARTVTRLTSGRFIFPATQLGKLCVRRM